MRIHLLFQKKANYFNSMKKIFYKYDEQSGDVITFLTRIKYYEMNSREYSIECNTLKGRDGGCWRWWWRRVKQEHSKRAVYDTRNLVLGQIAGWSPQRVGSIAGQSTLHLSSKLYALHVIVVDDERMTFAHIVI